MRFTWGTFKYAVRDPTFSVTRAGPAAQYPNTLQSLRAAVRAYHDSGEAAARAALRRSFRSPYWKTPVGAGKVAVAHDLLDEYIQLAIADGRPASHFGLRAQVAVGPDVIDTIVDVCVFASVGFGGRVLLWDTRPCSREDARVLAWPVMEAIEDALGPGSAEDAAVWHFRSASTFSFTPAQARRARATTAAVLRRAQL